MWQKDNEEMFSYLQNPDIPPVQCFWFYHTNLLNFRISRNILLLCSYSAAIIQSYVDFMLIRDTQNADISKWALKYLDKIFKIFLQLRARGSVQREQSSKVMSGEEKDQTTTALKRMYATGWILLHPSLSLGLLRWRCHYLGRLVFCCIYGCH